MSLDLYRLDRKQEENSPKVAQKLRLEEIDREALSTLLWDPVWRICNLYVIVDRWGNEIPFEPNQAQMKVITDLYVHGYRRQIILKARQLGMSTLIEIILLDMMLFNDNTQVSIVADTADNAKKLLKSKLKYAYDRVLEDIKKGAGGLIMNDTEISLTNGSSVSALVRQRSGTNQGMHISEWGKIAHTDPKRSTEIRTGALPTVAAGGIVFAESTFEGGKGGDFYAFLKRSMETKPEDMTELDFLFQFFPWYEEESYSLEGRFEQIPKEYHDYFEELEQEEDIYLTKGQKLWYYKTAEKLGDEMKREHPSTPQEAFEVPVQGAIYGPTISKIRANKQIIDYEHDSGYPVNTFWDIGLDDYTVIWWIQIIGPWIYVLDHFRVTDMSAIEVVDFLNVYKRHWRVTRHYLPHDAGARSKNDKKTYEQTLNDAGLKNTLVIPQPSRKWDGINQLKTLLKKMIFHKTRTATDGKEMGEEVPSGVTSLESYHKRWLEKEQMWHHEPVHDWSSHDADGLRTFAEAYRLGLVDPEAMPSEHRHVNKTRQARSSYSKDRAVRGRRARR